MSSCQLTTARGGRKTDPSHDPESCPSPAISIVQGASEVLTETFLRAQAERLPGPVTVISGYLPRIGGRPILSDALTARIGRKIWRGLTGKAACDESTDAYITAFRLSRASVILAQYGPTGVHVMEACRRIGLPLVVHFHGYDASERSVLETYASSYTRLFNQAAAIIVVSEPMRRRLISLGAPPEKLHYNPYGVDCGLFTESKPSSSPPVFLAVGRFVHKKAPHLTIAAFAEVRRLHPQARLRMVGDGPLMSQCFRLVRELSLSDAVDFLGAQTPEVVRKELQAALSFVQHSVEAPSGDCEGTPVGIIEAGASGLPVVATRHAGIPEVVLDGETGLLVEERDVSGMAKAMARMLDDPTFAERLGQAARRHVLANYELERRVQRLWLILRSCIDRN